ncbi:MAG TPA: TonB-dependent receptor [Chthoniobacterales bacterium]|jgi:iron complex outermembrane receptor protein
MCHKNISGVWIWLLTLLVGARLLISTSSGAPPVNENGIAMPEGQGSSTAEAERVIVTGSNIPTAEEVGPNPVLAVNRDLIEKSGERQAAELLRDLPIANANGVPVSNNATGSTPGAAAVSLRGFTPEATLLLIDGRRVAPYPIGQNAVLTFQDLFTVPLSAVQSIEILKDGASTTYGADAVAGVVNLKFWKDYRGAQVTLQYGNTIDKDAAIYSADILFGVGDDKLQISGDIFIYHHDSLFNHDRGNSWITPALSSNSSPENIQVSRATALPALGLPQDPILNLNSIANPGLFSTADGRTFLNAAGLALIGNTNNTATGVDNAANMTKIDGIHKLTVVRGPTGAFLGLTPNNFFFEHSPHLSDGLSPPAQLVYSQGRTSFFNFNAVSGSYPEQERYGGYVSFSDKICDDILQIYGDFYYTKVKTHNELASAATGSFFTPGSVTIAIPPQTNLNGTAPPNTPRFTGEPGSGPGGVLAPGENPTSIMPDSFNPFNPFNQILSGGSRARLAEFGNRFEDNTSNAFLATLGVKGDKLLDGNWGYDAGFRYSEIDNDSTVTGVSATKYSRILNAADPIFDPTSSEFIGTTIPYNPFGDFRRPIPANAIPVAFATVHPKDIDISKLTELDLNIYTTELFKLPAGGIGLAFGGQFRRENIVQDPDSMETAGDIIGQGSPLNITHAGRKDYALYGEMRVPLFSPEMGIVGLHSMEVTGAFRFEEFLNNNTNVMVPKVGLRWQPLDEELTIRSTWGEGFLEPSLFELYSSPNTGLQFTRFNGVTDTETTIVNASNPNLPPEHSNAWTGGAVYTPKWLQWGTLTLSLDLWDIERRGVVVQPSAQEVVNRFAQGRLLPGEVVDLDPTTGGVNFVRTAFQNGGRQNARGADLGMQYQIQTQFGTFTALAQWAYLDQFVFQATPDSKGRNVIAQFQDGGASDGYTRWKGVNRIDWAWHNFDLNLTWHFLGGFREILKNALQEQGFAFASSFPNDIHEHWVHPTNFIDGQASYRLIFVPPVEPQPVAGYSKGTKEVVATKDGKAIESTAAYSMSCWKTILNNSTLTIGCNNIFGQDPPPAFGFDFSNLVNYPGSAYDNIGRFWYVQLQKKF